MKLPRIDSDELTAYFDEERNIAHVIYRGEITAALTVNVYEWMVETAKVIDVERMYGGIFDFREVTDFKSYSLSTVMRQSQKLNIKLDLSRIPTALIVKSALQEQMLRVAMKVTPQDYRKRIVRSEQEALAFFEDWHKRRASAK